ncbi:MAG: type II secretion system protein [Trueperaceae bacterium]
MRGQSGFSLIEVLIALAVIGIAFAAMALIQITNIKASVSSRLLTETKAAANRVLEERMAAVLVVTGTSPNLHFDFHDWYWSCLNPQNPPSGPTPVDRSDECTGSVPVDDVDVNYVIAAEGGILGEGVLTITVTAVHDGGQTITIGDRVTCYDVFPSPTSTAPEPCPQPGGGRT